MDHIFGYAIQIVGVNSIFFDELHMRDVETNSAFISSASTIWEKEAHKPLSALFEAIELEITAWVGQVKQMAREEACIYSEVWFSLEWDVVKYQRRTWEVRHLLGVGRNAPNQLVKAMPGRLDQSDLDKCRIVPH
ncbi:MAG: hypothetical protein Q9166_001327 [cf. Caloplaca sp. 2 TL-2023]